MTPAQPASLPLVFVDGELTEAGSGSISPRDRGFTLADGLFETMRVHNGIVFRLDRHLTRLSGGLRVIRIPQPRQRRGWVERAGAQAGPSSLSVRLTVTRGQAPGGLAPPHD